MSADRVHVKDNTDLPDTRLLHEDYKQEITTKVAKLSDPHEVLAGADISKIKWARYLAHKESVTNGHTD